MQNRDQKKGPRGWRLASGLGLLAILGLGVALALTIQDIPLGADEMASRVKTLGPWAPLGVIGLMVVHCFVPFPAEFLALGAGAVFGPFWGAVYIWIGAMIGAALSFALARWLGRGFVEEVLSPRNLQRLNQWSHDHGALTLLGLRFLPVIAFNLINYAAGLTRVTWFTFLWTTGVGILPLTIAMTYLGHHMADLSWPWLIAIMIGGFTAIALIHVLFERRRKRAEATSGRRSF